MYSYGPPHMAKQKQDDQLEHTYSSYVRIQDVALKTCQKWWILGRSCERWSGRSVLVARHDDDDDDDDDFLFDCSAGSEVNILQKDIEILETLYIKINQLSLKRINYEYRNHILKFLLKKILPVLLISFSKLIFFYKSTTHKFFHWLLIKNMICYYAYISLYTYVRITSVGARKFEKHSVTS